MSLIAAGNCGGSRRLAKLQADRLKYRRKSDPARLDAKIDLALSFCLEHGKFGEGVAMLREVLAVRERDFGPENWATLQTKMHLAGCLQDTVYLRSDLVSRTRVGGTVANSNGYAEALALFREVVPIIERKYGAEAMVTLFAKQKLAHCLKVAGKPGEAIAILREVVPSTENLFGPEDVQTRVAKATLAISLGASSKHKDAQAILQDVLAIEERVLGPEHPEALDTKATLAECLFSARKYEEAAALFMDVHAARVRVLGPEHPETLMTKKDLEEGQRRLEKQRLHGFNVVAINFMPGWG